MGSAFGSRERASPGPAVSSRQRRGRGRHGAPRGRLSPIDLAARPEAGMANDLVRWAPSPDGVPGRERRRRVAERRSRRRSRATPGASPASAGAAAFVVGTLSTSHPRSSQAIRAATSGRLRSVSSRTLASVPASIRALIAAGVSSPTPPSLRPGISSSNVRRRREDTSCGVVDRVRYE